MITSFSPTTYNAFRHFRQFWDGRAADVEEQAGMPILNPVEMAIPSEEFLRMSEALADGSWALLDTEA